MMDHHRYPEFRVVPDCTLDGIDPRGQNGFYVRCATPSEARAAYWDAHPRVSPRDFRLYVERWKEPTPLPKD